MSESYVTPLRLVSPYTYNTGLSAQGLQGPDEQVVVVAGMQFSGL